MVIDKEFKRLETQIETRRRALVAKADLEAKQQLDALRMLRNLSQVAPTGRIVSPPRPVMAGPRPVAIVKRRRGPNRPTGEAVPKGWTRAQVVATLRKRGGSLTQNQVYHALMAEFPNYRIIKASLEQTMYALRNEGVLGTNPATRPQEWFVCADQQEPAKEATG